MNLWYELTYWTSLIICNLITPKIVVQTEEVIVKDINGLMAGDIAIIEKAIDKKPYRVGDELVSVAYKQGQADLIERIKTTFCGRQHGNFQQAVKAQGTAPG